LGPSIFILLPVSTSYFFSTREKWELTSTGSESTTWGSPWIANHGAICVKVGKPCILEEYGVTTNKTAVEGPWQATALSTAGIAGDMYWQYGDTLSSGRTSDDGNTIYYGSSDFDTLVTQHVSNIKAKG
jgi:mannan endo-1,4-beta-mannosidase